MGLPAPQQTTPSLASPFQRIGAAITDLAVLLAANIALTYLLVLSLPPEKVYGACIRIATFYSLVYLIVLWSMGQTLGKRIFAIKIVGPDGRRPGLRRGVLRFAGYVIASLPFKIGLLPILWDPLRRGWHDQIAGTLVVKEDATPSAGWPFRVPEGRAPPPPAEPVTPDDSAPGLLRWRDLLMLPVFALATALLTWPVVIRLPRHFPSDGGDANIFVWNLWWARKVFADPHLQLFQTDYLFWPQQVNLRLHSFSLFNCALGVPLQKFLSPTLAYSVLLLLALCLTAFAAYLLGKYVTGSTAGGLLVGLFSGFSPYMMWHAYGHLDLVSSEWIVLYALLLLIVLKKAQIRHALLAAAALALASLASWHHLTHLAVFTVVFSAAWLAVHWKGAVRRLALIGLAGILALALLAAWLVPMARAFTSGEYNYEKASARWRADLVSLDAASLLVPPPYHPLLGRWTSQIYRQQRKLEKAGYLGWTVLALAALALWQRGRRRAHLPWLVVAIAFILLSFGFRLSAFGESSPPVWLLMAAGGPPGSGMGAPIVPSLAVQAALAIVGGSFQFLWSPEAFDMPFSLLWKIGGASHLAAAPCRFAQIAGLALAILAAIGALHLARLAAARRGKWAGGTVLAIAGAAVMFEYLMAPRFPTEPAAIHPFYHRLARERDCAAILEVPINMLGDAHFQRAQTIHGKHLYVGCLSRRPDSANDFLEAHPLLSQALTLAMEGNPPPGKLGLVSAGGWSVAERRLPIYRADLRALAQTGCCYIALHKDLIEADSLRLAHRLFGGALRLPVALNDSELIVYRVRPPAQFPATGPRPRAR